MSEDLFGCVGGDFLDVDAARRARHEDSSFGSAIDDDSDVCLARDGGGRRDQDFLNWQALDRKLENLRGDRLRFLGSFRQPDATGFSPSASVNLSFDDDSSPESA